MMLEQTTTAAPQQTPIKGGYAEQQFTALVDEYGSAILALLRRLCRNNPDADDAFQESAIRVWRGLAHCPPLSNARSWLLTIAFRAFVDLQAKRQRNSTEQLADPTDNRITSPTHAIQQQEENQRLEAALASLPAGQREVVALHYTGGLTLSETAAAMNLAEGTVKSRLHAALDKLRSRLS